jgi:hypothetical protein
MNDTCRVTNSLEWKRGWGLKSGGFATLCYSCGSAYQNLTFCDKFHLEESGWRECKYCGKRLHCGCIASKYLHHYLDFGGIGCLRCVKDLEAQSIRPNQHISSDNLPNGFGTLSTSNKPQASVLENRATDNPIDARKLILLGRSADENQPSTYQNGDSNSSSRLLQIKQEQNTLPSTENGANLSLLSQPFTRPSIFSKPNSNNLNNSNSLQGGLIDIYKSLVQPSLTFPRLPLTGGAVEGVEENKVSIFQEGQSSHFSPKPNKPPGFGVAGQVERRGKISQPRISRPPADGRGRNHQLLPRYWPKITEQELQQLSGDLNSTIVPLFEKVLSASDAGRIGRLVLPKACAEAYFPPISQSEGLPMRIKDIKGKEWTFQFRFWTNNNSRMYVLEGVTPCLQHMQLQAGDTVTFSRIDPGGKFIMGFRKATNVIRVQDTPISSLSNTPLSGEASNSGLNGILALENGENGVVKKEEEQTESTDIKLKKKKSRQIGLKSKRLHMHSEDAIELRVTWEEAQELLRPSPTSTPTVVIVDEHEVEEYDQPPILGKRSIFTAKENGEQEQWVQCDDCVKWRSLPPDIVLSSNWVCSDNIHDPTRNTCSAPDDMFPKTLRSCSGASRDFKKRMKETKGGESETEAASGLDALATAAVLEDLGGGEATTRHPRHRSGCSCIVCIQPPSGKGKHRPACICNVCSTVRRRFKTFMLRKRKREQSELLRTEPGGPSGVKVEEQPAPEPANRVLDLNCHPKRDEEVAVAVAVTVAGVVAVVNVPPENGVSSEPCAMEVVEVVEDAKKETVAVEKG